VIGAGYIGVEAADALRRNGLRVTVLERSANVLLRDDEHFTTAVRKQLEEHGVDLRCGVNVSAIEPDRVADVACEMVVIAAGFKPNVELAREAGIELGRTGAIRADDRMETNLHGVYAAGDCAEVMHLVTGRPTWIPLGTTANKTGRVAGANAAGSRERFAGVVGTSIVGIFGRAFATTGLFRRAGARRRFLAGGRAHRSPRAPALLFGRPDHRRAGGRPRHPPPDGRIGDRGGRRRRPHQCHRHRAPGTPARRRVRATGPGLFSALLTGVGPPADRGPATRQGAVVLLSVVFCARRDELWGRLETCGGLVTARNRPYTGAQRRLPTGAQDTILPHNQRRMFGPAKTEWHWAGSLRPSGTRPARLRTLYASEELQG